MPINENIQNVFCYLVTLYATNKKFVYFEKIKYKIKIVYKRHYFISTKC